jgi:hypothetical protein
MKIASHTPRVPHLVQALEALALQPDHAGIASRLIDELSGITVLVAKKFTNDRTADGLLDAYYLTTGCVSLGISLNSNEPALPFLMKHGAERVFQMGFRSIKELSGLPAQTLIADFDSDPEIQQRNIKSLFLEICRADPNTSWTGDEAYKKELQIRRENQEIVSCAKWLRNNHYAGAIREADLDASAVIAVAVIFAILNDGRIVARIGQKDIEELIRRARQLQPDVEIGWQALLRKAPTEFQNPLRARMDEFKGSIVKKILSKTKAEKIVAEIQNCYAGVEQDVEYD